MMINPEYAKPILTLANKLTKSCVPYTLNVLWDGLQIRFPWNSGDLVCHSGSYGCEQGDLESLGCPWDEDDVTRLSVEDACEAIAFWYDKIKN